MEKYLNAAEQVSAKAIAVPPRKRVRFETDALKGAGSLQDGARFLASQGEIFAEHNFPKDGEYLVRIGAWAMQAGEEPARMSFKLDKDEIKKIDVPATQETPRHL